MAILLYTATVLSRHGRNGLLVQWDTMTNGDTGNPVQLSHLPDKTLHIHGDLGGGTFILEGSNNGGVTWFTLRYADTRGQILVTAVPDGGLIVENPLAIRPRIAGGALAGCQPFLTCF